MGNIEHIESESLNGVAVVKVYLQPKANVDGAIAEVIAEAQATLKQLPTGITPPLVIRYDASTVPILQLGLSGNGLSEQELNDLGVNFIRPQLATVPGASVPIRSAARCGRSWSISTPSSFTPMVFPQPTWSGFTQLGTSKVTIQQRHQSTLAPL